MRSEIESLHETQTRRQRDKDSELRKLKKAEYQLKAAKDSLQLVEKKYDNKQSEVIWLFRSDLSIPGLENWFKKPYVFQVSKNFQKTSEVHILGFHVFLEKNQIKFHIFIMICEFWRHVVHTVKLCDVENSSWVLKFVSCFLYTQKPKKTFKNLKTEKL